MLTSARIHSGGDGRPTDGNARRATHRARRLREARLPRGRAGPDAGNGRGPDPSLRRRGEQHRREHAHRLVLEACSLGHGRRSSDRLLGRIHGRLGVDGRLDLLPPDPGSGLLRSHRRGRRRRGLRANRGTGASPRSHALARWPLRPPAGHSARRSTALSPSTSRRPRPRCFVSTAIGAMRSSPPYRARTRRRRTCFTGPRSRAGSACS